MGGDGGEKEGRVTKSKHKTSKTLVVQMEDPCSSKAKSRFLLQLCTATEKSEGCKGEGGEGQGGGANQQNCENCLNSSARAGPGEKVLQEVQK